MAALDAAFWAGKRVLLTGHTGFKGAWAAIWLSKLGAQVTGLALPPDTTPSLFSLAHVDSRIESRFADLRNPDAVGALVGARDFDLALHMAASRSCGPRSRTPSAPSPRT